MNEHFTNYILAPIKSGYEQLSDKVTLKYHQMTLNLRMGCHRLKNRASLDFQYMIAKVSKFISENKETLFYRGCEVAMACLAPELFFSSVVASIIVRIVVNPYLKDKEYFIKDRIRLEGKKTPVVDTCDVAMASIAAIGTIAFRTLFKSNPVTACLFPILGGMIEGNSLAKPFLYSVPSTNQEVLAATPRDEPVLLAL